MVHAPALEQTTVPVPVPTLPAPARGLARLAPALAVAVTVAAAPALAPAPADLALELYSPPADPQQSTDHSGGNTLWNFHARVAIPWR